jgi:putative oxidoreductase
MSLFQPAREPWPGRFLAIFRVVAGLIFVTAGTMKLFGFPPSPVPIPPLVLWSQMGIGGILEVFGGALIVVGLFTRPVAFILSGMMAVAYWQFHAPGSFWPTVNQGTPAILYCFLFLYLAVAGAGAWSIDAVLARRRQLRGNSAFKSVLSAMWL